MSAVRLENAQCDDKRHACSSRNTKKEDRALGAKIGRTRPGHCCAESASAKAPHKLNTVMFPKSLTFFTGRFASLERVMSARMALI